MSSDRRMTSTPDVVSLADEDNVKALLRETLLSLWEAVNTLTRLRPTSHERYRVTIFGSARAAPGSWVYDETRRMAAALTEMGCDIITGGGPGLMEAANEGAAEADPEDRTRSVGIRVSLPFEQSANPFVEQVFEHRTFFTRLHHFVLASDAFIIVPGGIGTTLETLMVWQLLQVRHLHETPLIMVGDMWKGLVDWAGTNMLGFDPQLANHEDIELPTCVAGADEAIELVREHHAQWADQQVR